MIWQIFNFILEQLAAVDGMRGDMPLLIIVNSVHFNEIGDVTNGPVDKILKRYVNLKFDFMVFDYTYKVNMIVVFLLLFWTQYVALFKCHETL